VLFKIEGLFNDEFFEGLVGIETMKTQLLEFVKGEITQITATTSSIQRCVEKIETELKVPGLCLNETEKRRLVRLHTKELLLTTISAVTESLENSSKIANSISLDLGKIKCLNATIQAARMTAWSAWQVTNPPACEEKQPYYSSNPEYLYLRQPR
jgi:hypothetical protein